MVHPMRTRRHQVRARPRRGVLRFAATSLGVAALVLTGCTTGDDGSADADDDSAGSASDAAPSDAAVELAQSYRSSVGEDLVTEEESLCFATGLIDGLGEDRVRELDSGAITPPDLDPAEQDEFAAAYDDCIPGTLFAKDFTAGVFSQLRPSRPRERWSAWARSWTGAPGR